MKQNLSLTPSTAPLGFDPWFGSTPLVVYGTVPAYPDMTTWMMQLWKYPHDAFEADAAPLCTGVGSESAGVMTVAFTSSQLSGLAYSQEAGTNSYWLTIGGTDANNLKRTVRGGTIELIPAPLITDAGSSVTGITITDDVASFVYNGVTYTLPVAAVTPSPAVTEGETVVIDDMLIIMVNGVAYTTPVVPVL